MRCDEWRLLERHISYCFRYQIYCNQEKSEEKSTYDKKQQFWNFVFLIWSWKVIHLKQLHLQKCFAVLELFAQVYEKGQKTVYTYHINV